MVATSTFWGRRAVRRKSVSRLHLGCARGPAGWPTLLTFVVALLVPSGPARAGDDSPELVQPPICSVATVGKNPQLEGICEVNPLPEGGNEVKIKLTANIGPIDVGGYNGDNENNNNYNVTSLD